MRALRAGVIGCIALALMAPAGGAQRTGGVSGYVIDSAAHPLPGVRVRVLGTPRSAITGAQGEYVLDSVPAGTHVIAFRRSAYAPLAVSLAIRANDIVDLDVRLSAGPVVTDTLAPPADPTFTHEETLKPGERKITRPDIARARRLSDVVGRFPRSAVRDGNVWSYEDVLPPRQAATVTRVVSADQLSQLSREHIEQTMNAPRYACGHAWPVFLDDMPLDPAYRLDDIPPGGVAGIRVHLPQSGECGVILVYSR